MSFVITYCLDNNCLITIVKFVASKISMTLYPTLKEASKVVFYNTMVPSIFVFVLKHKKFCVGFCSASSICYDDYFWCTCVTYESCCCNKCYWPPMNCRQKMFKKWQVLIQVFKNQKSKPETHFFKTRPGFTITNRDPIFLER